MGMPLRRLVPLLALLLSVFSLAVAGRALLAEWTRLQDADRAALALADLKTALVAAEMASRERGPSNALMGQGASAPAALRDGLSRARARTDRAIEALQTCLRARAGQPRQALAQRHLEQAVHQLQAGRAQVDAVVAQPHDGVDAAAIRQAVQTMAAVIPELGPAAALMADALQRAAPALAPSVQSARMAADLREFAGLLGSHLTAALTQQRPLTVEEHLAFERTRGRLDQVRGQLALRLDDTAAGGAVQAAWRDVSRAYFSSGLDFVEAVAGRGARDAAQGPDPAAFAQAYVPRMDAIVALRDQLLAQVSTAVAREAVDARWALAVTGSVTAATLLLLGLMAATLKRRLLDPLGATVQVLHAMARNDHTGALPVVKRRDEMAEVVDAVAALRQHARRQEAMALERSRLIAHLNERSNTDFLTGLSNRRCFVDTASTVLARAVAESRPVALVLLDLDHFKSINDRHGHDGGDRALVAVAEVLRGARRAGDLAARMGGEEFVVLLEGCDEGPALQFAQRLREQLSRLRVTLAGGGTLQLTASLGVAVQRMPGGSLDDLIRRADAAMYQAKSQGRDRAVLASAAGAPGPAAAP